MDKFKVGKRVYTRSLSLKTMFSRDRQGKSQGTDISRCLLLVPLSEFLRVAIVVSI